MAAIVIPQEYSYVLLAATSTIFVNAYHMLLTSSKRKASGIQYPITYASQEVADKDPKAFQFNCGMLPLSPLEGQMADPPQQPSAPTPTSPRTSPPP